MTLIPRGYIVDSNNQKTAVILDIKDFNLMEDIIEQQGLAKMMDDVENEDALPLEKAKEFCKFY